MNIKGKYTMLMGMAAMMGMPIGLPRTPTTDELRALCDEFNLIQQKKSKLSRSKRDHVCQRVYFHTSEGYIEVVDNIAKLKTIDA